MAKTAWEIFTMVKNYGLTIASLDPTSILYVDRPRQEGERKARESLQAIKRALKEPEKGQDNEHKLP